MSRPGRLRARVFSAVRRALPRKLAAFVEDGATYTVGLGPSVGAGLGLGVHAGGGLFVHQGGLGHYGAIGLVAGALANASAGLHFTIVKGGPEDFFGVCKIAGVGVSPAFTFVTALYNPERELLGFTVDVALGHALPLEGCIGVLKTVGRAWGQKATEPSPA